METTPPLQWFQVVMIYDVPEIDRGKSGIVQIRERFLATPDIVTRLCSAEKSICMFYLDTSLVFQEDVPEHAQEQARSEYDLYAEPVIYVSLSTYKVLPKVAIGSFEDDKMDIDGYPGYTDAWEYSVSNTLID